MAVRVTLLIKKLDTLSDEEFHKYWEGPHAKLFLDLPIVKEKVVKFSQFHIDHTIAKQLGLPAAEYDGEVNLWFHSMEDCMAMYTDAEYQRTVVPDGDVFSKTEESRVMIGYDKDFVVDEKVL